MSRLVVPVVGLKGGTSKSTTAVFLAHAFCEAGRSVLLVDADPQASVLEWQQLAPQPFPFDVTALATPSLDRQLADVVRHRYDTVVIDCPPREHHAGIVAAALRVATVAVVPVAPTPIEYSRLAAIRAAAEGVPLAVLFTRTIANAVSTLVYREAALGAGLWVLGTQIGRLEHFAQAFGDNVHLAVATGYGDAVRELLERCT